MLAGIKTLDWISSNKVGIKLEISRKHIVKSSYPKQKWKNSEKMKVLKSVNLHLEYVPRCFRNQMQKKKSI